MKPRWTTEKKLKFVKDYIKTGKLPKNIEGIKNSTIAGKVIIWTRLYKKFGYKGLTKRNCKRWFYEDKVKAIRRIKKGEPMIDVAVSLGMNGITSVSKWWHIYKDKGLKGLKYQGNFATIRYRYGILDRDVDLYINNRKGIIKLLELIQKYEAQIKYLKKIHALILKK